MVTSPLISDTTTYIIFWVPIAIAVLVLIGSILKESRKD
jgi:hypothetical protein